MKRRAAFFVPAHKRKKNGKSKSLIRAAPPATRGFFGSQTRLKRQMMGMFEKKVVDTAQATYACDTTGSVTFVNGATGGSAFTERIGRRYTNVAVQVRGLLRKEDDTSGPNLCRILLVYDSQPNGVIATIAQIFNAATSTSMLNLDNRERFRVIADRQYTVGEVNTTATQTFATAPGSHSVNIYRRINLETTCDGTTNGIGDVNTGAIYLVTLGNNAAGAGASFIANVRVRFIDG